MAETSAACRAIHGHWVPNRHSGETRPRYNGAPDPCPPFPFLLSNTRRFSIGMFLGMIPAVHESFELYSTIVTPIGSNSEQPLEEPVNHSTAGSPGDVAAPTSGARTMLRDHPFHSLRSKSVACHVRIADYHIGAASPLAQIWITDISPNSCG